MTVPLLHWCERPARLHCAGCGRRPLCGFADEERTLFYGACCWDDGEGVSAYGPFKVPAEERRPRLRTAEERQKVLNPR